MLAFDEELSGYELKKWADWSIKFFYWSPSFSQVYTELKKLEKHGFVTSRVQHDNGVRGRRLYKITEAGTAAVGRWSNEAPIDPPILKHGVMLRIWLGHLNKPERLKEILREHIEYVSKMERRAAADASGADKEPAWAYSQIVLRWAERYYAAERDLAEQLIADIDKADAVLAQVKDGDDAGFPKPTPGAWRQVEVETESENPDLE
ncbi:PadR family transcriptional regulator [Rhodococcus oryzae]|jgi:DNA-binding PadR family transcriptional regulator|uniref:PadR family transcriptional regulator n=1 Tax=Rhodococcus oryzae TaxID=2571143 RepID=A0ABY2RPN3_9NOCA|nr:MULTISPECIES: PadR family transcriptional regulator [Rhodococcus]MCZ4555872.1 PadR family transcriptional regulator [Rhodococcus maanshanensis]TJZ80441.1 PadR family transcriptional regulator [Rhodococcus oryzae]